MTNTERPQGSRSKQASKATPLHDKGEVEVRASTGGLFTVHCDCGAFTLIVAKDRHSLRAQLEKLVAHKRGKFPDIK